MNREQYLKKIHNEIIEIMDYIDEVCQKNQLKYFLTGGTLLGAIRHSGFIPWDDDLDIEMPRSDYEKLLMLVQQDDKYKVLSYDIDSRYPRFFAKITKAETKFIEEETYQWGIFVDIFPIDNQKSYGKHLQLKKKVACFFLNNRNRILEKDTSNIFKYFIARLLPSNAWMYLMKKVVNNSKNKEGKFYINYGSQYSALRRTMPKEWYNDGVKVVFEGRMYNAPSEFQLVLNRIFGSNYMEVPPVEKQKTHYPICVKFSDGEEVFFEAPEKKVTIEETLQ